MRRGESDEPYPDGPGPLEDDELLRRLVAEREPDIADLERERTTTPAARRRRRDSGGGGSRSGRR